MLVKYTRYEVSHSFMTFPLTVHQPGKLLHRQPLELETLSSSGTGVVVGKLIGPYRSTLVLCKNGVPYSAQ